VLASPRWLWLGPCCRAHGNAWPLALLLRLLAARSCLLCSAPSRRPVWCCAGSWSRPGEHMFRLAPSQPLRFTDRGLVSLSSRQGHWTPVALLVMTLCPCLLLGDASGSRSVWPLQFTRVVSRPTSDLLGARTHCHPQPEPLVFTCLVGSCAPLHSRALAHRFSALPIRPAQGFMWRFLAPVGSLGSRLAKTARLGPCRASAWTFWRFRDRRSSRRHERHAWG
jgi:hypothetical protein